MIKEQTLILKIKYDDEENRKPSTWDWAGLLNSDHEVEVLNYSSEQISSN